MEKRFQNNSYFILYANCIPVKGATRSLICDLQKGRYYFIPNDLYNLLQQMTNMTFLNLYENYNASDKVIIQEYIDFMLEKDLGFIDSEPHLFTPLSLDWHNPSVVNNAIIDIDPEFMPGIDYRAVFTELSDMNCFCVQIRCFKTLEYKAIDELLSFTLDSRIKEVRLVLPFNKDFQELDDLLKNHKRLTEIIFFRAEENAVKESVGVQLVFLDIKTLDEQDCGQICATFFSINVEHFTESQTFNSCLNRKVSIDKYGNIKNCPSQKVDFGNIASISLKEAIYNRGFQDLWKLKKDDIKICRDCEYRYICTDCRIFIEDQNDIQSKPSKCTYDPYNATWN